LERVFSRKTSWEKTIVREKGGHFVLNEIKTGGVLVVVGGVETRAGKGDQGKTGFCTRGSGPSERGKFPALEENIN